MKCAIRKRPKRRYSRRGKGIFKDLAGAVLKVGTSRLPGGFIQDAANAAGNFGLSRLPF